MGQTPEGARKAAQTAKRLHGEDFHRRIGAQGGKKSRGGFAKLPKDKVKEIGKAGGRAKKGWRKPPQ